MPQIQYNDLLPPPTVGNDHVSSPLFGGTGSTDYLLDGNYTKVRLVGAPTPEYPFQNQGDNVTVIFRQHCEQAVASYQAPNLTVPLGTPKNAFPFGDVDFEDGGAGVWSFVRRYGNIPQRRTRLGQSHRYAFQYILDGGIAVVDGTSFAYQGPSLSIGTLPFTVNSTLTYDYFMDGQQESYPLLEAPQVLQIGDRIYPRGVDLNGGNFPLYTYLGCVCSDVPILAEDDVYADWEGAIKCRVRRTIAGPSKRFWTANL